MPIKDPENRRKWYREYVPTYRKKRREKGACIDCGAKVDSEKRLCPNCLEKQQERDKEKRRKRKENGCCVLCGKPKESAISKCDQCRANGINYLRRLKAKVIEAYGGKCQCCGEEAAAFLTIDHTNNNGTIHRKSIGSNRIYSWLEKKGYPKDEFQLLCFNCNCGRQVNGGICPHQIKRAGST